MRRIQFCLVAMLVLAAVSVHAEVTVKQYLAARQNRGADWLAMRSHIAGFVSAMYLVNRALTSENKQNLYCQPNYGNSGDDIYIKILDDALDISFRNTVVEDDDWIDGILLRGLEHAYPCEEKHHK
jgi:hypothetical protein